MRGSLPKVMGSENEHPITITNFSYHLGLGASELHHDETVERTLNALYQRFFGLLPQPDLLCEFKRAELQRSGELVKVLKAANVNVVRQFWDGGRWLSLLGELRLPHWSFMDPLGGRIYDDHHYVESSSPPVTSPFLLCAIESAREKIIAQVFSALFHDDETRPIISKNVSDGLGHSQGAHRSFCIDREFYNLITSKKGGYHRIHTDAFGRTTELTREADLLALFHVVEQIFTGAGKFSIAEDTLKGTPFFQISGRADFFETLLNHVTTETRPLINLRDRPLGIDARYHCISGDANRADWSKIFRMGLLSIFLGMLRDGALSLDYYAIDPLTSVKTVSRDLTLREPIPLMTFGGEKKALSVLEIWTTLIGDMKKYAVDYSVPGWYERVVEKAEWVLWAFSEAPEKLETVLDWKIKERLIKQVIEKQKDPRPHHMDYQSLAGTRLKNGETYNRYEILCDNDLIETVVPPELIAHFMKEPPDDTRAYCLGNFIRRFYQEIDFEETGWSMIGLKSELSANKAVRWGGGFIKVQNPLAFTKEQTSHVFEGEQSLKAVLEKLGEIKLDE